MTPVINQLTVRINELERQVRECKKLRKNALKQVARPALKTAWQFYGFQAWVFVMLLLAFPLWAAVAIVKGWIH